MNGNTAAGTFENQPDLLARLHNVVRQLNRSDIRTVSALIAKAMGDQQAAMMAVRLLHWFPKAKKLGGWVYKSWRDWNAECNLSQAQVKRVHGKGLLEAIGIERTIMKANGTPTVHYRLDENRLIQKLAEFLEIIPIRITAWMWPEPPNQDGQSDPSQAADSDQSNGHNQPNSLGENDPMNSAKTTQSITDSHSQTQQHTPHQDRQHNKYSAVVVDAQKRNPDEVIQALVRLGISSTKANQLIQKYGAERVLEVVNHAEAQNRNNPAGYVIRALVDNWTFYSTSEKEDYAWSDGSAYITGKYASFIEH